MCPTGTRANQNRNFLAWSLGNFVSSLFRKPQIFFSLFLGHRLHLNAPQRVSLITK